MTVLNQIWLKNDDHLVNLLFVIIHKEILWKWLLKSVFQQGDNQLKKITKWILLMSYSQVTVMEILV